MPMILKHVSTTALVSDVRPAQSVAHPATLVQRLHLSSL